MGLEPSAFSSRIMVTHKTFAESQADGIYSINDPVETLNSAFLWAYIPTRGTEDRTSDGFIVAEQTVKAVVQKGKEGSFARSITTKDVFDYSGVKYNIVGIKVAEETIEITGQI